MKLSLNQALQQENEVQLSTSVPVTEEQMQLLETLNQFAIHQAQYNPEVRQFPAKITYKVNEELKMGLIALLTTCSMLDPKRLGHETFTFFDNEIKIRQANPQSKIIDFGRIRRALVQQSILAEIMNDWFLYRDVNGDGIHALADRKTYLQGLASYTKGGHPVYEFARFYRRFMEDKLAKKLKLQESSNEAVIKALAQQVVEKQLQNGCSPADLLNRLEHGENVFSLQEIDEEGPKKLTHQ